ncbi:unnamed protein product, partial [Mesorhabditis belari]|uniref:HMG box domain-containing protein n=1 Tax=Mesorhabditis belari TaxID=2138241 RepID=A0AAF3EFG5_9BILA
MIRSFANLSVSSGSRCFSTSVNKKSSLSTRPIQRPTYSPYNLFIKEQYPKLKTHENERVSEVMKKIASAWKNVSAAEKDRLTVQAKKVADERKKALSDAEKLQIRENRIKRKERTLEKDVDAKYPDRPKKPASAYGLYLKNKGANAPRVDGQKLDFKQLASDWKNLGESEKEKYRTEAEKAMSIYNAEVKEWRDKHGLKKM